MIAIIHIQLYNLDGNRDFNTELIHIYENAKKYDIEFNDSIYDLEYNNITIEGTYKGYRFEFLFLKKYFDFSLRSTHPSKIKEDKYGNKEIDLAFYSFIATRLIERYAIGYLIAECNNLNTYNPPISNFDLCSG